MKSSLFSVFRRNVIPTMVSYKIKSGSKFSKFKDSKKLPNNAKFFLPIHRETLNISYKNVYTVDEIINSFPENKIDNDLLVNNFTRKDLLSAEPGSFTLEKLNNDNEKSLAIYLNEVLFNDRLTQDIQETHTNTFVDYLFRELRFDKYPLSMKLQLDFSFRISEHEVFVKIEFSVIKNKVTLCIDEDKHIHTLNRSTKYGESQISAEIFACAYTNFENFYSSTFGKDQTVYAIRVIGTRFTFYKVFLSSEYFKSLDKGFSPNDLTVTIYRFPPNDNEITPFGYDYADKDHRRLILNLLFSLKEYMLKI
ncbi:hypothetical protein Glove_564g43 [Diversispora epigaea]|uniref:Uncharacterized protein n=1 Tax=Diversispora epigaea TaxID=1348612 RepID=A0A397GG24_9GLOM|nr:hypothetical protein Glove_564g43 [Diversispora epigaea]